jgi:hypothetical protein
MGWMMDQSDDVQASERRLELLSKSEVVCVGVGDYGMGTAKKLRGGSSPSFHFRGHLGVRLGGKEVWRLGRSKRSASEAGWVEVCWGEAPKLDCRRIK